MVCSYNSTTGDNIVAYNGDGLRLWTSGSLLNEKAYTSAPMVNRNSGAIAADDTRIVRFTSTGGVIWNTPTPGGVPISTVVTDSGVIVMATYNGPVSAFDSVDGRLLGSLFVRETPGGEYFHTRNTPCVNGNRVYISVERRNDPENTARLVAIDVDPADTEQPLKEAWHFTFGGPSGASPLCKDGTIYFDGDRFLPAMGFSPTLFAVKDEGTWGRLLWSHPVADSIPASLASDPRGGFWVFAWGDEWLERRSTDTGDVIELLNVRQLVGDPNPNVPSSALTMAGSATRPVLILSTGDVSGLTSYVLAIDLVSGRPIWKVNLKPDVDSAGTAGQFPIVFNSAGKPVVVFSGMRSGAYFLAEP